MATIAPSCWINRLIYSTLFFLQPFCACVSTRNYVQDKQSRSTYPIKSPPGMQQEHVFPPLSLDLSSFGARGRSDEKHVIISKFGIYIGFNIGQYYATMSTIVVQSTSFLAAYVLTTVYTIPVL